MRGTTGFACIEVEGKGRVGRYPDFIKGFMCKTGGIVLALGWKIWFQLGRNGAAEFGDYGHLR